MVRSGQFTSNRGLRLRLVAAFFFSLPTYPPSDDGPVDYRAETASPASPPGGAVMGSHVPMCITCPYKKADRKQHILSGDIFTV